MKTFSDLKIGQKVTLKNRKDCENVDEITNINDPAKQKFSSREVTIERFDENGNFFVKEHAYFLFSPLWVVGYEKPVENFEVGDRVKIYKSDEEKLFWDTSKDPTMSGNLGKIGIVKSVTILSQGSCCFVYFDNSKKVECFPFSCLKKVSEYQTISGFVAVGIVEFLNDKSIHILKNTFSENYERCLEKSNVFNVVGGKRDNIVILKCLYAGKEYHLSFSDVKKLFENYNI